MRIIRVIRNLFAANVRDYLELCATLAYFRQGRPQVSPHPAGSASTEAASARSRAGGLVAWRTGDSRDPVRGNPGNPGLEVAGRPRVRFIGRDVYGLDRDKGGIGYERD